MALSSAHDTAPHALFLRCDECGAGLAYGQRYCVECGARRGPLPRAIAELIGVIPGDRLGQADGLSAAPGAAEAAADGDSHEGGLLSDLSQSTIGVAVMALLAFGVLVGSAVSPVVESAATAPIIVAVAPSPTASTGNAHGDRLGDSATGGAGSYPRADGLHRYAWDDHA